mmetsp:Transcript_23796/g.81754  ORF Transcript_23796/g.81754 Transcript_23796/m.81754 type:complete len:200 (-) Transcript_23796:494-1093(-)
MAAPRFARSTLSPSVAKHASASAPRPRAPSVSKIVAASLRRAAWARPTSSWSSAGATPGRGASAPAPLTYNGSAHNSSDASSPRRSRDSDTGAARSSLRRAKQSASTAQVAPPTQVSRLRQRKARSATRGQAASSAPPGATAAKASAAAAMRRSSAFPTRASVNSATAARQPLACSTTTAATRDSAKRSSASSGTKHRA